MPGLQNPQPAPHRTAAAAATADHRTTKRGERRSQSGSAPWDVGGLSSSALLSPTSSEEPPSEEGQDTPIYTEFDEDFEEEPASPIGHCVAIYHFEGISCLGRGGGVWLGSV